MADFPVRGLAASESVECVHRWLELGDKVLALNPLAIRRRRQRRVGHSTLGSGRLRYARQRYEKQASSQEIHRFSIVRISSVDPKKRRSGT